MKHSFMITLLLAAIIGLSMSNTHFTFLQDEPVIGDPVDPQDLATEIQIQLFTDKKEYIAKIISPKEASTKGISFGATADADKFKIVANFSTKKPTDPIDSADFTGAATTDIVVGKGSITYTNSDKDNDKLLLIKITYTDFPKAGVKLAVHKLEIAETLTAFQTEFKSLSIKADIAQTYKITGIKKLVENSRYLITSADQEDTTVFATVCLDKPCFSQQDEGEHVLSIDSVNIGAFNPTNLVNFADASVLYVTFSSLTDANIKVQVFASNNIHMYRKEYSGTITYSASLFKGQQIIVKLENLKIDTLFNIIIQSGTVDAKLGVAKADGEFKKLTDLSTQITDPKALKFTKITTAGTYILIVTANERFTGTLDFVYPNNAYPDSASFRLVPLTTSPQTVTTSVSRSVLGPNFSQQISLIDGATQLSVDGSDKKPLTDAVVTKAAKAITNVFTFEGKPAVRIVNSQALTTKDYFSAVSSFADNKVVTAKTQQKVFLRAFELENDSNFTFTAKNNVLTSVAFIVVKKNIDGDTIYLPLHENTINGSKLQKVKSYRIEVPTSPDSVAIVLVTSSEDTDLEIKYDTKSGSMNFLTVGIVFIIALFFF